MVTSEECADQTADEVGWLLGETTCGRLGSRAPLSMGISFNKCSSIHLSNLSRQRFA